MKISFLVKALQKEMRLLYSLIPSLKINTGCDIPHHHHDFLR